VRLIYYSIFFVPYEENRIAHVYNVSYAASSNVYGHAFFPGWEVTRNWSVQATAIDPNGWEYAGKFTSQEWSPVAEDVSSK
jgi:hypothetical protein